MEEVDSLEEVDHSIYTEWICRNRRLSFDKLDIMQLLSKTEKPLYMFCAYTYLYAYLPIPTYALHEIRSFPGERALSVKYSLTCREKAFLPLAFLSW